MVVLRCGANAIQEKAGHKQIQLELGEKPEGRENSELGFVNALTKL